MSTKNSAGYDTKNECDFYSDFWEEIVANNNEDFVDSDSESDLYIPFHPNSPCSLSEKENGKSKLSETVPISEPKQINFDNCCKVCSLLLAQKLENTRQFHTEQSPDSTLLFTHKDYHTSDHSSKTRTSKIFPSQGDGSCTDHLCLHSRIPHLIISEKSVRGPTFCTAKEAYGFDKLHQNQSLPKYPHALKQNKAVQVSLPCTQAKAREDILCFEQSAIPAEVYKSPARKSIILRSVENSCSKKASSSQLAKEHFEDSSELSYNTDSPQTAEQIDSPASPGGLVISLTLEAAYVDSADSLAKDIGPSKAKVGEEGSHRHALAFAFKDPEYNNLFKKLHISITPSSVHVDTENPKQAENTPFTKQTGLQQILVDEASLSSAAQAESSESKSLNSHSDQVPFTLEPQFPRQFFSSSKHIHATQPSYLVTKSFSYHKATPTYQTPEVEKHQLKASRPTKSVVFTKNKVQKCRGKSDISGYNGKSYISSKCNWPKTWHGEPIHQNIHHQTVKESEINELYYMPLTRATTCHCSPLLDLAVHVFSEGRYSSTEKLLSVKRKPHKRTGSSRVKPRFPFQHSLHRINSSERLQYISPIRKKSSLKMQSILNSCLGWAGGQNKCDSYKREIYPTQDISNTRKNGLFTPRSPTDGRSLASPHLPNSRNHPIPIPLAVPLANQRQTLSLAALCPDCKCRTSYSSNCTNTLNMVQPPKERNMAKVIHVEELDSEAPQVVCGGLAMKKFLTCLCGNVPQHGLFPNGDVSWSVRKTTRASPRINQRDGMAELTRVNCPRGTFNSAETYCTNCHHPLPNCCFLNSMSRGEASRSQLTKTKFCVENASPMKNLKDVEEESEAEKKGERKALRIHIGSGTLREIGLSGAQTASPSNNSYRVPKYFLYHPEYCSGCQSAVKQHLGTSREVHNCFCSKHNMLENCLNRESIFLPDPCQRTRTQCTCSSKIPLFCTNHIDTCNGNRAALSKKEESDLIQDSSQINNVWTRINGNYECCQDKSQYNRLQ